MVQNVEFLDSSWNDWFGKIKFLMKKSWEISYNMTEKVVEKFYDKVCSNIRNKVKVVKNWIRNKRVWQLKSSSESQVFIY